MNKQFFETSLRHIVKYGDTDIFPFPVETRVFADRPNETVELLEETHQHFERLFTDDEPPVHQRALSASGYTGFRWATQLDPLWNLYFTGLVTSIAEDIEAIRVPIGQEIVFSYRFEGASPGDRFFRKGIGWTQFKQRSADLAQTYSHVLACDVSDFYSRIYHHRLENALLQAVKGDGVKVSVAKRIMRFLQQFANNNSYGLPIGGNAARLLSEVLLNRTDRLFLSENVCFCRFADDYLVFANSEEEAFRALVLLSEKLLRNEGLSLQKAKTRILPSSEFLAEYEGAKDDDDSPADTDVRRFMRLSLHFDPYSETAIEDYEELKVQLATFDLQRLLQREVAKSRIHSPVAKKLVTAIEHLDDRLKEQAIETLLDNMAVLSPIFPSLMLLFRRIYHSVSEPLKTRLVESVQLLIKGGSHITQVEVNLLFALRFLGEEPSQESETILNGVFKGTGSGLVRREIVNLMCKWEALHWLSDIKTQFNVLGPWERRSFVIASHVMADEGRYWRDKARKGFSRVERLCDSWAEEKQKLGQLCGLV